MDSSHPHTVPAPPPYLDESDAVALAAESRALLDNALRYRDPDAQRDAVILANRLAYQALLVAKKWTPP